MIEGNNEGPHEGKCDCEWDGETLGKSVGALVGSAVFHCCNCKKIHSPFSEYIHEKRNSTVVKENVQDFINRGKSNYDILTTISMMTRLKKIWKKEYDHLMDNVQESSIKCEKNVNSRKSSLFNRFNGELKPGVGLFYGSFYFRRKGSIIDISCYGSLCVCELL